MKDSVAALEYELQNGTQERIPRERFYGGGKRGTMEWTYIVYRTMKERMAVATRRRVQPLAIQRRTRLATNETRDEDS